MVQNNAILHTVQFSLNFYFLSRRFFITFTWYQELQWSIADNTNSASSADSTAMVDWLCKPRLPSSTLLLTSLPRNFFFSFYKYKRNVIPKTIKKTLFSGFTFLFCFGNYIFSTWRHLATSHIFFLSPDLPG